MNVQSQYLALEVAQLVGHLLAYGVPSLYPEADNHVGERKRVVRQGGKAHKLIADPIMFREPGAVT